MTGHFAQLKENHQGDFIILQQIDALRRENRFLKVGLILCLVLLLLTLSPFLRYKYHCVQGIWFCIDRLTGRVWELVGGSQWIELTQPPLTKHEWERLPEHLKALTVPPQQ